MSEMLNSNQEIGKQVNVEAIGSLESLKLEIRDRLQTAYSKMSDDITQSTMLAQRLFGLPLVTSSGHEDSGDNSEILNIHGVGKSLISKTRKEGSKNGEQDLINLISDFIAERWSQGKKTRILEIGAGRTYTPEERTSFFHKSMQIGVPSLSRALATSFREEAEVVASDLLPDNFTDIEAWNQYFSEAKMEVIVPFFYVTKDQKLYGNKLWVSDEDEKNIGEFAISATKMDNEKLHSLQPLSGDQAQKMFQKSNNGINSLKFSLLTDLELDDLDQLSLEGRVYLRPPIDPVVEKSIYNLDFRGGVNYRKLERYFKDSPFNIVILQHPGGYWQNNDEVLDSVSKILSPGGVFIGSGNFDSSGSEKYNGEIFLKKNKRPH